MNTHIVIVGGGQAAVACITKLRGLGHSGEITLVSEESRLPYQRPPLSKQFLLGKMSIDELLFQHSDWYEQQSITVRLDIHVTNVNATERYIESDSGERIAYDKLVWTAGSTPVNLPSSITGDSKNISVVRDLPHVERLQMLISEESRVLIVGGGYIGLEAAAVCRQLNAQVLLLEAQQRILQRVASAETADFIRQLHRDNGVIIAENTTLDRLVVNNGSATAAKLNDGTDVPVDLVIVGIGVRPNIAPLQEAGLTIDNGVSVNQFNQTSDPNIYAAGDCCSFERNGQRVRLESVQNANDQGETIAWHLCDQPKDYASTPWFWSDQYDTKLQIAGLNSGYDRTVVRPGSKPGSQSVWYYQGDRLLAVDAINEPGAFMVTKRLLDLGKSPSAEDVQNPEVNLKAMMKDLTRP